MIKLLGCLFVTEWELGSHHVVLINAVIKLFYLLQFSTMQESILKVQKEVEAEFSLQDRPWVHVMPILICLNFL